MKNHLTDFVKKRFKVSLDELPEAEHRVVQHLGERRHISRDINLEFDKKLTLGQRLADRVAAFGGSWTFIIMPSLWEAAPCQTGRWYRLAVAP